MPDIRDVSAIAAAHAKFDRALINLHSAPHLAGSHARQAETVPEKAADYLAEAAKRFGEMAVALAVASAQLGNLFAAYGLPAAPEVHAILSALGPAPTTDATNDPGDDDPADNAPEHAE